jgi:hypothetical protein
MSDDYNQRQYWLMLERLSGYEANTISLHSLSNDLEGLIYALEGIQESFRDSMLSFWGVLHDIAAGMIDNNTNILDEECARRVNDAVAKLKYIVLQQIDDPADAKRGT